MEDMYPDFLKELTDITRRYSAPEQLADLQSELTAFIEKRKSENLYLPIGQYPDGKSGVLIGIIAEWDDTRGFVVDPILDCGA